MLLNYGFTNFKISELVDKPAHYHIIRKDGTPANNTLSEGEATFISFLYYMQLVKGSHQADGITSNRVLVIDDPVSSLDSTVLFIVSTLIKELFAKIHKQEDNIKQIILFTHNVYFHKEISFCGNKCQWRNDIAHWILRKNNDNSTIQAYGNSTPIKSSYDLLWSELRNENNYSSIVIQNIMRRIIETYFLVFGGMSYETILESFTEPEDKQICKSLLSLGK